MTAKEAEKQPALASTAKGKGEKPKPESDRKPGVPATNQDFGTHKWFT